MRPIRLGVIGTGLIWMRTHQPQLERLQDAFTPVAFCDLSEQRRAAVARAFPDAAVLGEHERLLALPEVEAVLVLTPIALNAPVARAALLAGKHVIMEKPIARSLAEGRELVEVARRSGRQLFVAEQLAYRRAEDALAEIIAAGEIGDLVMWNRVLHLDGDTAQGELRYDTTPWRKQPDFPLGAMFDGGIHLIASLSKVFGAPASVAASGTRLRPDYGEYDQVSALFRYAGGFSGLLSHSSYLRPAQNHFQISGSAGVIAVEQDRIVVERPEQPARVVELPEEDAYAAMWRALVRAFQGEEPAFYTPERALSDVATLVAVERSIKSGGAVVPTG
jgi:predicted dehydrogenase